MHGRHMRTRNDWCLLMQADHPSHFDGKVFGLNALQPTVSCRTRDPKLS